MKETHFGGSIVMGMGEYSFLKRTWKSRMTNEELIQLIEKEKALLTEAIEKVKREEFKTLEEAENWLDQQRFQQKIL
jgi:hypothetical protein